MSYPGYADTAIDERFGSWTISNKFALIASGKMPAAEALSRTDQSGDKRMFGKWQAQVKA